MFKSDANNSIFYELHNCNCEIYSKNMEIYIANKNKKHAVRIFYNQLFQKPQKRAKKHGATQLFTYFTIFLDENEFCSFLLLKSKYKQYSFIVNLTSAQELQRGAMRRRRLFPNL